VAEIEPSVHNFLDHRVERFYVVASFVLSLDGIADIFRDTGIARGMPRTMLI
jgi:hypothetical protein